MNFKYHIIYSVIDIVSLQSEVKLIFFKMAPEQGFYAQVVMIRRMDSDDIKEKDKT